MLIDLAPADLELCAETVALLGADQPEEAQEALAWVARNRVLATTTGRSRVNTEDLCFEILKEATGAKKPFSCSLLTPEWSRIYQLNCRVWSGEIRDRTDGATACHRHDREPDWAKNRIPTALIGSFMFFR